jgi:hypothetical protein
VSLLGRSVINRREISLPSARRCRLSWISALALPAAGKHQGRILVHQRTTRIYEYAR